MFVGILCESHIHNFNYFYFFQTYVGDPYQDEKNQAALLLHEDSVDGSLLMV